MDTLKIKIEADASDAKSAGKEATKAFNQVGEAAKDAGQDLAGMGHSTKNVKDAIEKASKSVDEASQDFVGMSKAGDKAETSIKHVTRAATGSVAPIEKMGGSLSRSAASAKLALMASEGIVNRYTALGAGIAAAAAAKVSGSLDVALMRTAMTAGATAAQAEAMRKSFFAMAKETGNSVDDLAAGFDNLIQQGASWEQAQEQIKATNIAMSVTAASAGDLTNALGVAGAAFDFDLAKPGLALQILDKMREAGGLASAEMNMLPGIFSRIGTNASRAGMNIDQTLAFVEVMSKIEKNPERLATLTDSTLRLFTNEKYMKAASKASGIKFFDAKGARRDVADVLKDMQSQFKRLGSDKQRSSWINNLFGETDLDTQKGIASMLSGKMLSNLDAFTTKIASANGKLVSQQQKAQDNVQSQLGRLSASMREAGEDFARPINEAIKNAAKWAADSPGASKAALYTGGGIAAASGTVVVASKLIEAWQTVRGLFRGKGAGAGTALGGAASGGDGIRVFVTNLPGGSLPGGAGIGATPVVAAEKAAAQAARAGFMQRFFPTFSRWGSSLLGWGKGLGSSASQAAQRAGVWAQGSMYTAERIMGRTAAGRWLMGAGRGAMNSGSNMWRNLTWGGRWGGALGEGALKLGSGGIVGAGLALPFELMMNKDKMRAVAGAVGTGVGGTVGGMIGAAETVGTLGLGGFAAPLLTMAGGYAGREAAVHLYDWIAKLVESPKAAGKDEFSPTFNIQVSLDGEGRPTTSVEGPGAQNSRVNAGLGPKWAAAF